jgi:hypothetical protein
VRLRGACLGVVSYGEMEKIGRIRDCSTQKSDKINTFRTHYKLLQNYCRYLYCYTCLWADMGGVSRPAEACQRRACEQMSGQSQ